MLLWQRTTTGALPRGKLRFLKERIPRPRALLFLQALQKQSACRK